MQHHTGDLDAFYRTDLLSAIGLISQNWMTQRRQMDAKLVSPACARVQQHMGGQFAKAMFDLIFRYGFFWSRRVSRKFFPFFPVTANCQLDHPMSFFGHAKDEGLIHPRDRMMFELSRKRTMGIVCLGDHHDSGCVLVQPMNQPWPFLPSDRRNRTAGCLKMMEEGIHQRASPMTRRRMNNQASWFV